MKLAFFTGARSEYGLLRKLISQLKSDSFFEISLLVGGMHLLEKFGNTYSEIEKDGFTIKAKIPFYSEVLSPGQDEFSRAINGIAAVLEKEKYDALFIVGDRLEAYAAALAAHFTDTPVIHSGGGTITEGAVDNIYRYNITNLANLHLATSKGNYERLKSLPVINPENVLFTGSVAIDGIREFLKQPVPIGQFVKGIKKGNFALITFHPATAAKEPLDEILAKSVELILNMNCQVLITYPNNDKGYESILSQIERYRSAKNVFIVENLGAKGYYAALNDCLFVMGNSSSGIVEAPYFHKQVINVGERQKGREKDASIMDVNANWPDVQTLVNKGFNESWPLVENNNIYGDGNSIKNVMKILKDRFK